jgi:hypothetical protein
VLLLVVLVVVLVVVRIAIAALGVDQRAQVVGVGDAGRGGR